MSTTEVARLLMPIGDASFPSCEDGRCVVGGFTGPNDPFPSWVPGELLVVFKHEIDEAEARGVVARELPDSEVIRWIPLIRALQISCTPFDEPSQRAKVETAPEVRYAEMNEHVHLGTEGGFWRIRPL